ncbi:MAG: 3-deoxy-7-phosphoheptulonate synthase, partial [Planctomycetes bacterium]|nr:3-deoxy-7-phosphoheptulonate synthase [Planctomycetota bacterium]
MIVVMKQGASRADIDHMIARVEDLGLKAHVIVGTERTVIAAIGEKREAHKESLESGPSVAEVLPILAPYKIASREIKQETTKVVAGSLCVGG